MSAAVGPGAGRSELFPPVVALAEADPATAAALAACEEPAVRGASPQRRQEFRAGRAAARAALAALGAPGVVLPRGKSRWPAWPVGFVGSISHCPGLCVAAVARSADCRAIGLDAEVRRRVGCRLHERVCTPREAAWMEAEGHADETATLLFSAKEATYKCLNPLTGVRLGFADVELTVDLDAGTFLAVVSADIPDDLSRLSGRFAFEEHHVLTGVAVAGVR